jgi:hypothetical protein
VDQATLPDGTQQIFVMSTDIADGLKEDLAWTSYILLRNTNAIAAVSHIDYHYWFIMAWTYILLVKQEKKEKLYGQLLIFLT